MFEFFGYRQPQEMLQGLEYLAILADEDVPVIALDKKKYAIRLLADIGHHYLEIEADVPAEFPQECRTKGFGCLF
jgi:hypothetical protein